MFCCIKFIIIVIIWLKIKRKKKLRDREMKIMFEDNDRVGWYDLFCFFYSYFFLEI